MTRFVLAAVAALAFAPAAVAQTKTVAVRVDAVDFEARVERAAARVCRHNSRLTLEQGVADRACRQEAVSEAMRRREAVLAGRTRLAQAGVTASGGQN